MGRGLEQVVAALKTSPGMVFGQLRLALPLAPVKSRLAVSYLHAQGHLRSRRSVVNMNVQASVLQGPTTISWYTKLLEKHREGYRLVMVTPPATSAEEVGRVAKALAQAMDGTVSVTTSAIGASFARIVTRMGVPVVVTFVPLEKRFRAAFLTAIPRAHFVLITQDVTKSEFEAWVSVIPEAIKLHTKIYSGMDDEVLAGALQLYATEGTG